MNVCLPIYFIYFDGCGKIRKMYYIISNAATTTTTIISNKHIFHCHTDTVPTLVVGGGDTAHSNK